MKVFRTLPSPPKNPKTNPQNQTPRTKEAVDLQDAKHWQLLLKLIDILPKLGCYSGFHKQLWCFMYTKLRALVISTHHGCCLVCHPKDYLLINPKGSGAQVLLEQSWFGNTLDFPVSLLHFKPPFSTWNIQMLAAGSSIKNSYSSLKSDGSLEYEKKPNISWMLN